MGGTSRRHFLKSGAIGLASAAVAPGTLSGRTSAGESLGEAEDSAAPLVIKEQGSFFVGGTVVTAAKGDTFHGDHAYVQYQVPPDARSLPLVMWHGAGQFSKTWETTPDGREGYQSIFVRRGFSTYLLDQPRRGRAGRGTVGATIPSAVANESSLWGLFRLGTWAPPDPPSFFPNVQFPQDSQSLAQYYRQQTPNTGPQSNTLSSDAIAALFEKIGPGVLITHSMGGLPGWLTAIKAQNVKAVVSYETSFYVFPTGEVPPPVPTGFVPVSGTAVSPADFEKLTRIPILLVFGDNIPTTPSSTVLDVWRGTMIMAQSFVNAVNSHGGDAELLHLPRIGVYGNTHFAFSDLNNLLIADLLSAWLHEKGLDKRGNGHWQPSRPKAAG
jgi:hypothetical protein